MRTGFFGACFTLPLGMGIPTSCFILRLGGSDAISVRGGPAALPIKRLNNEPVPEPPLTDARPSLKTWVKLSQTGIVIIRQEFISP